VKKPSFFRSCQSFTLVEMLTAMAVLALLLALLFSMLESASQLTDSAEKGGDSAIQAKQVLDRIGLDVAGMVNRFDVDQFYYQPGIATGNDKMFFYSEALGYSSASATTTNSVSLIGYRVENNPNLTPSQPVLQRLALGLPLAGAAATVMQFLCFPASAQTIPVTYTAATPGSTIPGAWPGAVGPTGDADNSASPTYYDEISSQVFRMEICFQDQSGKFSMAPPFVAGSPTATTITNSASAIIVAIAVLDSKSRLLISTPAAWTALQQALPDLPSPIATSGASGQPILMDSLWNSALANPATIQGLKTQGVPISVTAHVRVYQRYYPLTPPLTPPKVD
jgi:Prokaryotic N-terminal methylation motif